MQMIQLAISDLGNPIILSLGDSGELCCTEDVTFLFLSMCIYVSRWSLLALFPFSLSLSLSLSLCV